MDCKDCPNYSSCIISLFNKNEQDIAVKYRVNFHYKKGKVVFHEGFTPEYFFMIKKGVVKVTRNESNQCQILRFAKSGEAVGYRSLIARDVYSTTAITLSETVVCCFPKNVFLD
ncbi:MAG: cyclic nucleotide-binding domain-containing protein, partial [Bacteroidia bacterium]|nr:cyclic nucleotide-binding domain-containing protein [Bacteroidia bacterium]